MADDSDTVCSMCGDIGLPNKLFRCTRCVSRYQHSYCSNYYEKTAGVCDWCLIEEERRHGPTSKKKGSREKVKRGGDHEENGSGGKGSSGSSSSSKQAGRRYKLLKDVLS